MKKLALLSITAFCAACVYAQPASLPVNYTNPYPKTITVNGSAELEVVPDELYVQVTLREYDKKGAGKIDLENIKTQFLNACKAAGIADSNIAVASYEGYDQLHWRKKKKDPDMKAGISYQIKFASAGKIDELVDKLDDEATQSFSIARTSHSRMTEFRKQLKIQAIKAAKEKGIYLTEAIGGKLGEAITIDEPSEGTDASAYASQRRMTSNIASVGFLGTDGETGKSAEYKKIKLRYEVNVVFALK